MKDVSKSEIIWDNPITWCHQQLEKKVQLSRSISLRAFPQWCSKFKVFHYHMRKRIPSQKSLGLLITAVGSSSLRGILLRFLSSSSSLATNDSHGVWRQQKIQLGCHPSFQRSSPRGLIHGQLGLNMAPARAHPLSKSPSSV